MNKENNSLKYDNDYINQFLDRCKSFPRVKVELVEPNVLRVETDKMYEGYSWIGASEHNINNGCRGVKEYNYALVDSTHLTIYFISDGEDNERLKAEIKELKADNKRLREGFGHGVLVELETLREERDEIREDNNEYLQYNDKLKAELKTAQDELQSVNDDYALLHQEYHMKYRFGFKVHNEYEDGLLEEIKELKAELDEVKRCNKTMDGILLERDADIKRMEKQYHMMSSSKELQAEAEEYFSNNPQSKGVRFHMIDFSDYDYVEDEQLNGGSGEHSHSLWAEDCLVEIDNAERSN